VRQTKDSSSFQSMENGESKMAETLCVPVLEQLPGRSGEEGDTAQH
jgi:hypothetical protein